MMPIISRTRKIQFEQRAGQKPREDLAISYHQILTIDDDLTQFGEAMIRVASASWARPSHYEADTHLVIETMSNGRDGYHVVSLSQKEAVELRKFLDHVLSGGHING